MDEKDFKKHLKDLAHGNHHPEEHDWETPAVTTASGAKPARKKAVAKSRRQAKRSGKRASG